MSDSQKTRPRKPDAVEATAASAVATEASTEHLAPAEGDRPAEPSDPTPAAAESPQAPPALRAQQPLRSSRRR
jgi:hypothetical protein